MRTTPTGPADHDYWSLKVFCAVAEEQSVTLAAKRLTLGQPGVSMIIHRLERHWGTALIQRQGNHIHLTEAGAALYDYAMATLRSARDVEQRIRRVSGRAPEVATILTRTSLATHLLPPILAEFWLEHPGVEVRVHAFMPRIVILREVFGGGVDFAVLPRGAGVTVAPGFVIEELGREDWIVVAAPFHPLAGKASVTLAELAQEPFIVGSRESTQMLQLRDRFISVGGELRVAMEIEGDGARFVLRRGVGVGLMLRCTAREELAEGKLREIPIPDLDMHIDLVMAHPAGATYGGAVTALMQVIRERAVQAVQPPPSLDEVSGVRSGAFLTL